MAQEMAPLRWGICSAGRISHDFVVSLQTLPEASHTIVAVAARSLDSAKSFAIKHSILCAYGSYEELAADPSIDVVYIGTISQAHLKCAQMMMSSGKPVLCEKPLTMNARDTRTLIDCARENNVFLMEAVWTRFLPSIVELRRMIAANDIGRIHYINIPFGCRFDHPGTDPPGKGGSLLDVGVYCIHFVTMLFEGERPEKIYAQGLLTPGGYDELIAITLTYSGGRIAQLTCATAYSLSCQALVSGEKGDIKIPQFWSADKLICDNGRSIKEFPHPKVSMSLNFLNSEGLCYQANEVRECIQNGRKESSVLPLREIQLVAEVMDEIMKQIDAIHLR